jgi:hypothetical protein
MTDAVVYHLPKTLILFLKITDVVSYESHLGVVFSFDKTTPHS